MDNLCIMCGDIIPEGRDVCPNCEATVRQSDEQKIVLLPRHRMRRRFIGATLQTVEDGTFSDNTGLIKT